VKAKIKTGVDEYLMPWWILRRW